MAINTSVRLRMAKGTDKAPTLMPMARTTLVNGRMAKGMDMAPTL